MNAIMRVEFELAYYDVTDQHVNHYATGDFFLRWGWFEVGVVFYFRLMLDVGVQTQVKY